MDCHSAVTFSHPGAHIALPITKSISIFLSSARGVLSTSIAAASVFPSVAIPTSRVLLYCFFKRHLNSTAHVIQLDRYIQATLQGFILLQLYTFIQLSVPRKHIASKTLTCQSICFHQFSIHTFVNHRCHVLYALNSNKFASQRCLGLLQLQGRQLDCYCTGSLPCLRSYTMQYV